MVRPLIFDFSFQQLTDLLREIQAPAHVTQQIFDWIYKKHQFQPASWSNISKKVKEFLQERVDFTLPEIIWQVQSSDNTKKFLLKMRDHQAVEAVVIHGKDRLTLCLSTQVGCAIGCTFCHTGTQGLKRHLKPGEIVGQFLSVSQWLREKISEDTRLTNIVYMGQGEPLHNFENVKIATENFLEPRGLGLSQRKITLSTSGLVPQIKKLGDFPPVNMAISLHAATDEIRDELMPINKVYDLKRLFEAIKTIPLKAHRRITYEYLLIEGLNNRPEDVTALAKLLHRKQSKVNLIPFNEFPGSRFKRPSQESVLWFANELTKRGLTCTVRATKGHDILAACGQLKTAQEKLNLWS